MSLELTAANDEMQALLNSAWQANASAVLGYVPEIEWYGTEAESKVDRSKAWARFSTQSVYEEQATLSACVDEPYKRRFESSGLVFLQLFLPKTIANAVIKGRQLAAVGRNAFRGKKTAGGVTFHNVRVVDVAPEDLFYRFNVVAEYDFDQIG